MKKNIFLLLLLFFLTGCAPQNLPAEIPEQTPPETVLPSQSAPSGLYLPESEAEQQSGGALRLYSLDDYTVTGFLPWNDKILLFSEAGNGTDLVLLSGDTLIPERTVSLPLTLTSRNATVQLLEQGISYFDGVNRQTVILDPCLQETDRISLPVDLCGMALLSRDGNTLYYCTSTAIRALDRSSGISRILKEASYPTQGVSGLLLEDSVLQISITDAGGQWRTLYLDTTSGQLIREYMGNPVVSTSGNFYCAENLSMDLLLFGSADGDCNAFLPADAGSSCYFLCPQKAAVTLSWADEGALQLDHFDLETGLRTASLTSDTDLIPLELHGDDQGNVWILGETKDSNVLCRWEPDASSTEDDSSYMVPFRTREEPDYDALASCSLYAQQISEKYGIEVLVYRDATDVQPWDYDLEYEHIAPVIWQELELLDLWLGNYPENFLKILRQTYPDIRISIVRNITGSPESGSLDSANGIQFWDGDTSYIVLAAGQESERALYHELFHLIDTVVLTYSTAYDQWEALNPDGFSYDYDYLKNGERNGSQWLQPGSESFIDTYSMSYPKEDRARIMEFAMAPGNADRFTSAVMQMKLRRLCIGIREGFDLKYSPEVFLWEQYLDIPLNHPQS